MFYVGMARVGHKHGRALLLVLFSARSLNNLFIATCWASEAVFVAKVYSKHGSALLRVVQCESSQ